jgi:tryptophan synthase alpha chain
VTATATNRIDAIFRDLRRANRRALMPFICAGHPTPDATPAILRALDGAGASVIEIGFPFSDPIADGPVIAAAMHEALQRGVTPASICRDVASVRANIAAGLVAMVSVSIVHRIGPERFAASLADAGFDGVILPDAPVTEAEPLIRPFRERGLTATLLVAPTTPAHRVETIVRACSGFVYLLARVGITGEASPTNPEASADTPTLAARIAQIRALTDLPIACGFGISTPPDIAAVVGPNGADAAIVGSALVKQLTLAAAEGQDPAAVAAAACALLATGLPAHAQ